MKKFIIISFVFVLILAMSAMASETRVWTMGNNNNVLIDDANIWMYPSTIVNYGNQSSAEYFDYDYEFNLFGVNWALNNSAKGVIGTYFSSNNGGDRGHFFYGQQFGGNNFGIHLEAYQTSYKYEGSSQEEYGSSYYNLTFGLSDQGGQWDVAANIGTGSYQYTDNAGFVYQESDGNSNFGVMGRYWKVRNPNYTQVYHLGFMMNKNGYKYHYAPPTADDVYANKYSSVDAGCGFNLTPSNNVLAVFDLGIMLDKYTYEDSNVPDDYTEKTLVLPYFKMGMDGEVFKWLDVRFGATMYWNNYKQEQAADSYSEKYSNNDTYFGLGFNFGRLHVDIEANPDLFFYGPDFISGADENLSDGSLSATYDL